MSGEGTSAEAGGRFGWLCVPRGTLESSPAIHRWVSPGRYLLSREGQLICDDQAESHESGVPDGTQRLHFPVSPAVNCWANFKHPSGMRDATRKCFYPGTEVLP